MSDEAPKEDPILSSLAGLPTPDVDPWRAARIRHHALAALNEPSPQLAWLRTLYDRVLEPVAVAGLTLAYLGWAVQAVNQLYGS